jgi:L-asparaginase II
MLAEPDMIGGRHDRLDTSLMKAAPGRLISKAGMEALRGIAILPGARAGTQETRASGMAVKIEDGDGYDRGTWAASVEALRQAGVLDGAAMRAVARYHRPVSLDPHGRLGAEAVPEFELAPVGELIG